MAGHDFPLVLLGAVNGPKGIRTLDLSIISRVL